MGGDLNFGAVAGGGWTGSGHNVWGKLLPEGAFALVFVSNEDTPMNVTCDAECFESMTMPTSPAGEVASAAAAAYRVRDLWAHKEVGVIHPPFSLTAKQLPIHGGVAAFKLSPTAEAAGPVVEQS